MIIYSGREYVHGDRRPRYNRYRTPIYVLIYAMVDLVENIYPTVNQFHMAGFITAPLVVIEVVLMACD